MGDNGYYRLSDVNKDLAAPLPVKNAVATVIAEGEKPPLKSPRKHGRGHLPATKNFSKPDAYQTLAGVMPAAKPPATPPTTPKKQQEPPPVTTPPKPKLHESPPQQQPAVDGPRRVKTSGRRFLKESSGMDGLFDEEEGAATSKMEDKAPTEYSNAVSYSDPKYETMACLPGQYEPFLAKPQQNKAPARLADKAPKEKISDTPRPPSANKTPRGSNRGTTPPPTPMKSPGPKKKKSSAGKDQPGDKKRTHKSTQKPTSGRDKPKADKKLPENVKNCPPLPPNKLLAQLPEPQLPPKLQKWLEDPNPHGSDPVDEDDPTSTTAGAKKTPKVVVSNIKDLPLVPEKALKPPSDRKKSSTGGGPTVTPENKPSPSATAANYQQIWASLGFGSDAGQQPPQSTTPLGPENLPPNVIYCPPKTNLIMDRKPGSGRKHNATTSTMNPAPETTKDTQETISKGDVSDGPLAPDKETPRMRNTAPVPIRSPTRETKKSNPVAKKSPEKPAEKPKKKVYVNLEELELDDDEDEGSDTPATGGKPAKIKKDAQKPQNIVDCPPLPSALPPTTTQTSSAPSEISGSDKSGAQDYEMINPADAADAAPPPPDGK